jgi:hypothetical protein
LESLYIGTASHQGLNQLNGLSNLQSLHVARWGPLAPADALYPTKLDLSGLKSLKKLNLSGLQLKDDDLAFLEHLTSLEDLFISTDSVTGASLRYLSKLPELHRLYISGLCNCTGQDLENLNFLPKLRDLHLTGNIANEALNSLTGPPTLMTLSIDTGSPIPTYIVTNLAKSHPVLEYIPVNTVPRAPPRPTR